MIGGCGHYIGRFKTISCFKHPFKLQYFFHTGIYCNYRHSIIECKAVTGWQGQVKFNGMVYYRGSGTIEHELIIILRMAKVAGTNNTCYFYPLSFTIGTFQVKK
jgi:hypothetical protein